jgi:hypothetical protein
MITKVVIIHPAFMGSSHSFVPRGYKPLSERGAKTDSVTAVDDMRS